MGPKQAGSVIVQSLKSTYEYIGTVMLANILWFFVGFFPVLVVSLLQIENPILFVLGLALTLITIGPATSGVHYIIHKLIIREEVAVLNDFKLGFRKFFTRSLALVILGLGVFVILVADLAFSVQHTNTIIRMLSGVWVYFMVFWFVMLQFLFPFLVQQDAGLKMIIKRAALITIDNVFASVIIAIAVILIMVISIVLAAPILLFFMGIVAFVQNYALIGLMAKYEKEERV